MNFLCQIIVVSAIVAVAVAAGEANLRKTAVASKKNTESNPWATRMERAAQFNEKRVLELKKTAKKLVGTKPKEGKALTVTYGAVYEDYQEYTDDSCGSVSDWWETALSLCMADTTAVGYQSFKYLGASDCTSAQIMYYSDTACATPVPDSTVEVAATFDSSCNGAGVLVAGDTADDDDNGASDSFSHKYTYCGWNKQSNPIDGASVTVTSYMGSTCSGTWTGTYALDADCTNYNGGGSSSVSANGNVLTETNYVLSNCPSGTGVVNPFFVVVTGCSVGTDDDIPGSYSSDIQYSSPAARWVVNVGLAALLAVFACVAI